MEFKPPRVSAEELPDELAFTLFASDDAALPDPPEVPVLVPLTLFASALDAAALTLDPDAAFLALAPVDEFPTDAELAEGCPALCASDAFDLVLSVAAI